MDTDLHSEDILWNTDEPIDGLWNDACLNAEFVESIPPVQPTKDDEREARSIVFKTLNAPTKPTTSGAAVAVRRLLDRYDFSLADDNLRLRTYAISRLLDLAESEKENIALGAITSIGKIAEVGLFETKISVSISDRSTEELEGDLQKLLAKYMQGRNEKVINP